MSRIAVVPGSFDPVTLGHLDIIGRTAALFDSVHVLVVHNPAKAALLPFTQRVGLIEQAITDAGITGDITVASWSVGLLVDYCVEVGAGTIVKGLRSGADLTYETQMSIVNRNLAGIETAFLIGNPATSHVSSSLVRQVAGLGGDISPYVPPAVVSVIQPRGATDHG